MHCESVHVNRHSHSVNSLSGHSTFNWNSYRPRKKKATPHPCLTPNNTTVTSDRHRTGQGPYFTYTNTYTYIDTHYLLVLTRYPVLIMGVAKRTRKFATVRSQTLTYR